VVRRVARLDARLGIGRALLGGGIRLLVVLLSLLVLRAVVAVMVTGERDARQGGHREHGDRGGDRGSKFLHVSTSYRCGLTGAERRFTSHKRHSARPGYGVAPAGYSISSSG